MQQIKDHKLSIVTENSKIKDTFMFSIPPISTCPGATPLCKQHCYAMKAFKQYPTVKVAWSANYDLTRSPDFTEVICQYIANELGSNRKTKNYRHFRIHPSGDFYNQEYLDKWIAICAAFPQIQFLAYTKSSHLDFSKRPANMIVYFSVWNDTKLPMIKFALDQGLMIARMADVEARKTVKTFNCKPNSKCAECRVCWANKTDIQFTLH